MSPDPILASQPSASTERRVVTIHQPEHLPWLGFFHKIAQADVLVLLDTVQFRKNYFGNRNRLLGTQGPFWVTVPVHQAGSPTYQEIGIAEDGRWARRYWSSVYYNYRNHPYFDIHGAMMDAALKQTWSGLAALNEHLIRAVCSTLGLSIPIVRASEFAVSGNGSLLLRDLCAELGASVYLSGKMGREYLDEAPFTSSGIEVEYQQFHHPEYPQRGGGAFVRDLSVLDLLMNCGPQSLDVVRRP